MSSACIASWTAALVRSSRLASRSATDGTGATVTFDLVMCSMLRSSRSSRGSRMVMAAPSRPARPVRPTRCTYTSAEEGKSKLITCDTLGISNPRAATSVATSSWVCPVRKACMTRSRWGWLRPPWMASARWPRPFSMTVTSSTSTRVRQNTRADFGAAMSRTRAKAAPRWGLSTIYAVCCTRGAAPAFTGSLAMLISTGCVRCRCAIALMRGGIVAEKSAVCFVAGVCSRMASRSSAKPMSSISSASSRTTTRTCASFRVCRRI